MVYILGFIPVFNSNKGNKLNDRTNHIRIAMTVSKFFKTPKRKTKRPALKKQYAFKQIKYSFKRERFELVDHQKPEQISLVVFP